MPKDKSETLQKILPCARREFLEKGYEKASMRSVAACAGISAAALYCHFADKAAMFDALVTPAADALLARFEEIQRQFAGLPAEEQAQTMRQRAESGIDEIIEYIYDHFDAFKLLVCCAEESKYEAYIHRLVAVDVAYTLKYIELMGNDAFSSGRVTLDLMHILQTSFYSGMFEMVAHGMSRTEANAHMTRLRRFFSVGWADILEGGKPTNY